MDPVVTGPGRALPCPVVPVCEGCGKSPAGLAVYEADTPVGLLCLTLCPDCCEQDNIPHLSCVETAERVCAHCGHTGRRLDDADQEGDLW
jgi:hypothetical protein